jgi:capsular exopolysaccharide synthesis family protein
MDVRDYARVLRLRWRLLAAIVLLGMALATLGSLLSPRIYEAKSQLFVSTSSTQGDGTSGLAQGNQFAQQRVKSYAEIMDSPMVTGPVVQTLGLARTPAALGRQITAVAPLDTVLIDVTVRDRSAVQAQRIADAVAERFSQVVPDLEAVPGGASAVKVSVVRPASIPGSPVSPRTTLNLALGLLVGLALGIGLVVLREALDNTIKGAHEVQRLVQLTTLGLIGFDPDAAKRPLLVHADPHSSRSEAFRQLRTNLQFVNVDTPPRSIVLTSALAQEGKSTTCCNLAITLAEAGVRVALVEADLRRPRLAEYLGIEGAVGLTDVLVGRAGLEDVLQPWGNSGLLVLPSGPTPPNPSELLGSQHMQTLLMTLEEQVDLVLVDAPPLLPVTDAAIVAAQTSGAIVVLRAGKTTRDQIGRAVEALRAVDANVYGVILNMVSTKGPDAYQYGYGYGYASPKQDDPPSMSPGENTPVKIHVESGASR